MGLTEEEKAVVAKIDAWQPTAHVIGKYSYYRIDEVQSFIVRYKKIRIAYGRLLQKFKT